MAGHFERRFGLAVGTREQDIHHARTSAAGKKSFHRGSHDFGFGFARLVSRDQRPETVHNDVHGVANFGQFFFALDRAGHVKLIVERHQFEAEHSRVRGSRAPP